VRKIFRSEAQRHRSAKRAQAELKARARHKARLARRPDKPPIQAPRPSSSKARKFVNVEAPANFSLVDNPIGVIAYFSKVHDILSSRRPATFDLRAVQTMTPDAIALLVASVNSTWFKKGSRVAGNKPLDAKAALMFDQSGFWDHVSSRRSLISQGEKKNLLLHRVTRNKVENVEAMNAGKLAVSHIFKDGRRIRPLYEVLIECMANTNNHADAQGKRGLYDWWLFVYNDPDRNRSVFTFLDLGVGVFRSLPVRSFIRDAMQRVGMRSNLDLLPKLFAGEISSRTLQEERGKGIPRIHEHARGGTFTRFVMITNDVYTDMTTGNSFILGEPFHGTAFCFDLESPKAAAA
jgi:hypothetical protein